MNRINSAPRNKEIKIFSIVEAHSFLDEKIVILMNWTKKSINVVTNIPFDALVTLPALSLSDAKS
jgi:hypothetical protein